MKSAGKGCCNKSLNASITLISYSTLFLYEQYRVLVKIHILSTRKGGELFIAMLFYFITETNKHHSSP